MSFIMVRIPDCIGHEKRHIKNFFDAMIVKLAMNSHKPGFTQVDSMTNLGCLKDEVKELEDAIRLGNSVEVMLEAADCANHAMIAAVAAIENPKPSFPAESNGEASSGNGFGYAQWREEQSKNNMTPEQISSAIQRNRGNGR